MQSDRQADRGRERVSRFAREQLVRHGRLYADLTWSRTAYDQASSQIWRR